MSQRWWPGLERQLEKNEIADQEREDRLYVDGGRRLPRWLVAPSATPYWIGLTIGIVGGLIGAAVGDATDWWSVEIGLLVGLVGTQLAVDGWYSIGARRRRRASPPPPTTD